MPAIPVYTSKTEMVAATLREMILSGQLRAGMALRQREIAEQLAVSPTPVREAFRILESEGLVAGDVHRGFTVLEAEQGEAEEVAQIRVALESLAASLAASRVTDAELATLTKINDSMARLGKDDGRFAELNRAFHFELYSYARSPLLSSLMRLLWRSLPEGRPTIGPSSRRSVKEHRDLIAALRRQDGAAAAQVMARHIVVARTEN
jgi:DNA-binding GntR family transcriptional regulator